MGHEVVDGNVLLLPDAVATIFGLDKQPWSIVEFREPHA